MKRLRALVYGLAAGLLLMLVGCHGAVLIERPYCAYRAPVHTVVVYRRAPVVYSRVYVAPSASYYRSRNYGCR